MVPVIIGAGGHAKDIHAWTGRTMIAHHEQALQRDPEPMIIGINDPKTRAAVAEELERNGWYAADQQLHPTAYRGRCCHLGDGVVVGPLSSLLTEVSLGRHVHIGAGCHLTRCTVGAFTTIAPGVTVCGDVGIGRRCMIGAGATIKNLVTIGDDVTVGAGAVVVCDIPNGMTVKGVPAR
jgi:sugar O-acyltransferase (sialic acid O-acetyltransferase NeuD family)